MAHSSSSSVTPVGSGDQDIYTQSHGENQHICAFAPRGQGVHPGPSPLPRSSEAVPAPPASTRQDAPPPGPRACGLRVQRPTATTALVSLSHVCCIFTELFFPSPRSVFAVYFSKPRSMCSVLLVHLDGHKEGLFVRGCYLHGPWCCSPACQPGFGERVTCP